MTCILAGSWISERLGLWCKVRIVLVFDLKLIGFTIWRKTWIRKLYRLRRIRCASRIHLQTAVPASGISLILVRDFILSFVILGVNSAYLGQNSRAELTQVSNHLAVRIITSALSVPPLWFWMQFLCRWMQGIRLFFVGWHSNWIRRNF